MIFAAQKRFGVELHHNKKAKAANSDKSHDGDRHKRVVRIGNEARSKPEYVESGVAERGDRMEHAVIKAAEDAVFRNKANR